MNYTTSILSKTGGRKENQDYCDFLEKPPISCWALADGLGGHQGGAVASRLAVEKILNAFKSKPEITIDSLNEYLIAAQTAIIKEQESIPRLFSMRTTAVILIADSTKAIWAHIGDSRLYHFRDNKITFFTGDHSVPKAMADAGDIKHKDIRFHEDRNRLLRTLGNKDNLRPKLGKETLVKKGDAFLLCTDGFWEYVIEKEMEKDLASCSLPDAWLNKMEKRVIKRAKGEYDNYSAMAVFYNLP